MDVRRLGSSARRHRVALAALAATFATALAAGASFVAPAAASAHVHHTFTVDPGDSVQAAVDKAAPGDTVKLEEGTYHQQINVTTDDITIAGEGPNKTVIKPPAAPSGNCDAAEGPTGICVGATPIAEDGPVNSTIEGVTVEDLTVAGFGGSGMFFFGTDGGRVHDVHSDANGGYGIFFNNSTHGVIRDNLAQDNGEAGIYYGHIADADALIAGNTVRRDGNGIFLRDSSDGTAQGNTAQGNCIGILVLDTGGGPANSHWTVEHNDVDGNNKACPGGGPAPPTSGLGIAVAGASFTTVRDNSVRDNNAGTNPTIGSAGVAVLTLGSPAASNNRVTDNEIEHNAVDIFWDTHGTGNVFDDNDCNTSAVPADLC